MGLPAPHRWARQEALRVSAGALFSSGVKLSDVARRLRVSYNTVSRWHAIFKREGIAGLRHKDRRGATGPAHQTATPPRKVGPWQRTTSSGRTPRPS